MTTTIERLAAAIGYPEPVPPGALSFAMAVDDGEVLARETGGRLILSRVLWRASEATDDFSSRLPVELAGFAAGRILREEAVLAWDPQEEAVILWQEAPTSLPEDRLRRFFEVFATSCDWWCDRVRGTGEAEANFPEMRILP